MGLDMYLHAERRFDPESEAAANILATAGITLDQLKERAKADPMEHEQSVYLDRWSYMRSDDASDEAKARVEASTKVLTAAGLFPAFDHAECNYGELKWDDEAGLVVSIEAAYWRKANAVHAWFVDECQGGVDECQLSDAFDGEKLAQLRQRCLDALRAFLDGDPTKAGEIMEPRPGFFFGAYDIDQWWAEDMADTVRAVERCIQAGIEVAQRRDGGSPVMFRYHSSW
jgi:hypothetical protein